MKQAVKAIDEIKDRYDNTNWREKLEEIKKRAFSHSKESEKNKFKGSSFGGSGTVKNL